MNRSYPRCFLQVSRRSPDRDVESFVERDKQPTAMYHSCWNQEATLCQSDDVASEVQQEIIVHLCFCGEEPDSGRVSCVLEPGLSGEAVPVSTRRVHANEGDKHLTMLAYKCAI